MTEGRTLRITTPQHNNKMLSTSLTSHQKVIGHLTHTCNIKSGRSRSIEQRRSKNKSSRNAARKKLVSVRWLATNLYFPYSDNSMIQCNGFKADHYNSLCLPETDVAAFFSSSTYWSGSHSHIQQRQHFLEQWEIKIGKVNITLIYICSHR